MRSLLGHETLPRATAPPLPSIMSYVIDSTNAWDLMSQPRVASLKPVLVWGRRNGEYVRFFQMIETFGTWPPLHGVVLAETEIIWKTGLVANLLISP